jgi:hypothetical protein
MKNKFILTFVFMNTSAVKKLHLFSQVRFHRFTKRRANIVRLTAL